MNRSQLPPVAILAGGLATRLKPLTETVPKSLVSIAGRPFLDHQIELLAGRGIQEIVMCVGHMGEMIEREFGDGRSRGVHLQYSFDGDQLLGTAGALRRALPLLGDEFLVLYGDSYLTCDYSRVASEFRGSGRSGLMTVFPNEDKYDASNVEYVAGAILAYDKKNRTPAMKHIDYGLGVFRSRALSSIRAGERYDLSRVYQDLLAKGDLAALEVPERFYEIGSFQGLRETSLLLGSTEVD
jgi:N-acetyl-alpha-D-muramate 1-phosphate uridylyltransferase